MPTARVAAGRGAAWVGRLLIAAACGFAVVSAAQPDTWTVNGKEMPLTEFAEQIATITGKTVVVDPRVKNHAVTVISDVPLDARGVYELFLTVIKVHDLGVVENNGVVSVTRQQAAKQSGAPAAAGASLPTDMPATQVVKLQHVRATDVQKLLRALIPQVSHMSSIDSPNVLVVSDYAGNLARLTALIGEIDAVEQDEVVHRVLEHAWVGSVAAVLESLMPEQIGAGATGPQQVRVVANETDNSLVLKGKTLPVLDVLRLVDKLDVPESRSQAAEVVRLSHADATAVAEILNQLQAPAPLGGDAGGVQPQTIIQADTDLNALVIRADPETTQELRSTAAKLDVRREQVLIEAVIVEVLSDVMDSRGVELAVGDAEGSSVPLASSTFTGIVGGLLSRLGEDGEFDPRAALAASTSPTIAIARLDPDGISFGAVINALVTDTRSNLLSTPSVLALDNEEATMIAGQRVPFRTGSFTTLEGAANPFQTIERENVGVELKVTPRIHDDASVRMAVSLKVGNVNERPVAGVGPGFADVVTNERSLEETVIADNRQIILLGGLIEDDFRDVTRKVPVLGAIPVVGRAFRSTTRTLVKRHLLMFLRPTILRSADEVLDIAGRRYRGIYRLQSPDDAEGRVPETLEKLFDGP